MLYQPGEEETVVQASAVAREGRYQYVFNDVAAGVYEIYAGSDADNDLLICDAGEACGSWLTVDQPISLNLESDRDDINFPVDYLVAIPTITAKADSYRREKHRVNQKRIAEKSGSSGE